jgi:hypothetical protein
MTFFESCLTVLGEFLLGLLLAGLLARRLRVCYSFTLYVLVVLVCELLITGWPGRFYKMEFWLPKEILLDVLKFAVALELAARTFRAFPGARATLRGVVFLVVSGTLVSMFVGPTPETLADLASQMLPRVVYGTIWLFTALAVVILWYRLPVHVFHKAILVGFVPYLLIYTVALKVLEEYGWDYKDLVSRSQSMAYLLLLAYWVYAAWRFQEGSVSAVTAVREATQPM